MSDTGANLLIYILIGIILTLGLFTAFYFLSHYLR